MKPEDATELKKIFFPEENQWANLRLWVISEWHSLIC
jgi:hypothetical protein